MKKTLHQTTNQDALRDCVGLLVGMLAYDDNFTNTQRQVLQQIGRELGSLSQLISTGYLQKKELPANHLQKVLGK